MMEWVKFFLVLHLILALVFSVTVGNIATVILEKKPGHATNSSSIACGNEPRITCDYGQRIRIDSIKCYKANNSESSGCSSERHIWEVQGEDLRKLNNFIYVRCSYNQTCNLGDSVFTPSGLDQTMWQIDIRYTCIDEEEFIDFCSSMVVNGSSQLVTRSVAQSCFCIIPENTNITVVEYTPCFDNRCFNSSVYINGVQEFDYETECMTTTYKNVHYNISNTETNITVETVNPAMLLWISIIENNSSGFGVRCNMNNSDIIHTSTSTLLASTSTDTISTETTKVASTVTVDVSVTSTTAFPTTSLERDAGQQAFPLMTVVGGAVGSTVAVVIIITVILCVRRKVRERNEADGTNNQYNRVEFNPKTKPKTRGGTNESYEETIDGNRKSNSSNVDTDNERHRNDFAENRNGLSDGYTPRTNVSVIYSKVNKLNQNKHESDADDVNAYAELNDAAINYPAYATSNDKGQHLANDGSVHDDLTESDEYSHINAAWNNPLSPKTDNYSHISLPLDGMRKNVSIDAGQVTDSYSHITINVDNQKKMYG